MFQCQDLADYPAIMKALSDKGSSGTAFEDTIPQRQPWNNPVQHCVAILETAAPQGYKARTRPAVVCMGPGGWTVANGKSVDFKVKLNGKNYGPQLGDWTITNDAEERATVLTLTNTKVKAGHEVSNPKDDEPQAAGSSKNPKVLPQTGAPAGLWWQIALGLGSLAGGAALLRMRPRRKA